MLHRHADADETVAMCAAIDTLDLSWHAFTCSTSHDAADYIGRHSQSADRVIADEKARSLHRALRRDRTPCRLELPIPEVPARCRSFAGVRRRQPPRPD